MLGLFAVAIVASLWTATAVYRLFPSRSAVWLGAPSPRLSVASRSASPLGRYRRIGIILAGGGAKGAYRAGSLAAIHGFLAERGALGSVRMIAATSVGAWNACFWLAGMVSDERDSLLERWWSALRLSEVVAPSSTFRQDATTCSPRSAVAHSFRALFRDHPQVRESSRTSCAILMVPAVCGST